MKSSGTGESLVERPLSPDKFRELCDPAFEADWYCSLFGVDLAKVKQTRGSGDFSGHYHFASETITYTKPYLGVVLHELAHHICHKQGLNGKGQHHDHNFARVLQEMIDTIL